MVTTVASRTTMSCAIPRTARIHQRLLGLEDAREEARVGAFCRVVVAMKHSRNFPETGSPVLAATLHPFRRFHLRLFGELAHTAGPAAVGHSGHRHGDRDAGSSQPL